jgi:formylmethanofuran dehydrogenase subunit E
MITFQDVVAFHGHACPGLAFGFRTAQVALQELGKRPEDEELVAIVENKSCAVDAIQAVAGCTLGKGNLFIRDYGKQVYTFLRRPSGEGIRVVVTWESSAEDDFVKNMWDRFFAGDLSPEVKAAIDASKKQRMQEILDADQEDVLTITHITAPLPERARIYPSLLCAACGEKVMEALARKDGQKTLCIPCAEKAENRAGC